MCTIFRSWAPVISTCESVHLWSRLFIEPYHTRTKTSFRPRTRPVGRPLKCNRVSMWESLKNCFEPITEIHIDRVGSMKDFYFDALDKSYWNKAIAHRRDPEKPIPVRPNPEASFNPRRSRRTQNNENPPSPPNSRSRAPSPNRPPPTPPRQRNRQRPRGHQPGEDRAYDPAQVGISMYDSLKILDLGYAASYSEVKAQFRSLARIYHPDKHDPTRTGMSDTEAKIFFQLLNNAHEYLRDKL